MPSLGRTESALLYNKSGGDLVKGDVVVIDTANATAFTTTTVSGYLGGRVGVLLEDIADDAIGLVAFGGWVPQINLSGSASIGDFVKCHTVAGQGVRHNAPAESGDFAQVLETGTSPSAILFGYGVITAGAAQVYAPSGLTGATEASRYVGGTTSGAPASGTFAVGDFVVARDGNIWICTSAGSPGTWVQPTANPPAYVQLQDQKSAGTDGGSATSGSWQTRTLNTEVSDTGGHCTLAANQFTLAAGTYEFSAWATANKVGNHKMRLANISDSTYIYGSNERANTTDGESKSSASGKFTIASPKTYEIQHIVAASKSTDGWGEAFNDGTEIYANIELWKVA